MAVRPRTVGLMTRQLLAIAIVGLLPLIGVTVSALDGYRLAGEHATSATTLALDDAALAALRERTTQTADQISQFLNYRSADTRAAALVQPTPAAFGEFSATHTSELWYVTGTQASPVEHHDQFPLYRELVAIDANGQVVAHVVDGKVQTDPGDPNSTASYLATAKGLVPGALSVSHLSRLYTPRAPNDATQPPGAAFISFNGVYRFIAARHTADGTFDGAVMLALDARHVMEFVMHILPTKPNEEAVWPDYSSGDYAYLFDDQGWTIAHPRLWTVRGDDANGQPIPAVSAEMTNAERDRHPFNATLGAWADPNLPVIFGKSLMGQRGFVVTVNQQNASKATTYAPVPFKDGDYATHGMFAMLAIGANTAEFHSAATTVAQTIEVERQRLGVQMAIVVLSFLVLLALMSVLVSRLLVNPILRLTTAARSLEKGKFDEAPLAAIRERRFADEVSVLAEVFAEMGKQVVRREQQLRTQIADLHIQIDTRRRQQQVDEITETDYFRNLRNTASRLRSRPGAGAAAENTPTPTPTPEEPPHE